MTRDYGGWPVPSILAVSDSRNEGRALPLDVNERWCGMIKKVQAKGFRGRDVDVDLGRHTLLLGENMAGKTSVIKAATLAVLGYLPGEDKRQVFLNASGDDMRCAVRLDKLSVARRWSMSDKGSISQSAKVNGEKVAVSSVEDLLRLAGGSPIADVPAFWAMSPRLQRREMLRCVADPDEAEKVLEAEDEARKRVNDLKGKADAAQQALSRLTAGQQAVERPAGDIAALRKELAEARALRDDLQKQVTESGATATTRKQLLDLVGKQEEFEASRDRGKRQLIEQEKHLEAAEKQYANADAAAHALTIGDLPPEVEAAIAAFVGHYDRMYGGDDIPSPVAPVVRALDALRDDVDRLRPFCMSDEEKAQAKDSYVAACGLRQEWDSKRDALRDAIAETKAGLERVKRRIEECRTARGRLDKLPEAGDRNLDKALMGAGARVAEMEGKVESLSNWQATAKQLDAARLDRDKLQAEYEAAKPAVQEAIDAAAALLASATDELSRRFGLVLPEGSLVVENNGTFRLGWAREGRPTVYREQLSGYEAVMFDGALGRAIGGPDATVFIDAGECGNVNLLVALEHIGRQDPGQVVVARWIDEQVFFANVPGDWDVVRL